MEDYERVFENKKILITGGLGFIGSTLAHKLVDLNPSRIVIVDSLNPNCGGNMYNIKDIEEKIDFFKLDVREEKTMDALIRALKPDYIFSLAGLLSHLASLRNPKEDAEINAWAQYNILEACRTSGHKVKILYAGTRGQYGKKFTMDPITEEASISKPADPNGISKNSGEQACLFYADHFDNIQACSLRMTNVYGPRHQMKSSEQGFLNWFIRIALDGKDITVYEPGTQMRDFNYIDDVVRALLMVMAFDNTNGKIYNLGSCLEKQGEIFELCNNVISVKDISEKVVNICAQEMQNNGRFELVPYPNERKKVEVGDIKMNFTKLYNDTGWMPLINLDEGLRKTIRFYIKEKDNYWS